MGASEKQKGGRWIYDIGWEYDKHREISTHTENIWLNLVGIFNLRFYL